MKIISIILLSVLTINLTSALVINDELETKSQLLFSGLWSTDEAEAYIHFSEEGYSVHIEMFNHGPDSAEWDYKCVYDETAAMLIARDNGTKTVCSYDFDKDIINKTIEYQHGSAMFFIDEKFNLIWVDEEENAGIELRFNKMGDFSGIWETENIIIEFYTMGDMYYCYIIMNEAEQTIIWHYFCKYDIHSENVVSNFEGVKEVINNYGTEEEDSYIVYNDGQAVFYIDDAGYLIWKDYKENQGEGLNFIKVTTPEE